MRFHAAMAESIPQTDRRTAECFRIWDKYRAPHDSLVQRARQTFSPQEYDLHPNVPLFAEHTTRDREGNMVIYDRNALSAILDRCNHRISDTGNFAPLIEGHTPDRDAQMHGAQMPAVLGYAGPYKLGMIGNENPRWAIFGDEWHHKEDAPKLRKMRRRSPEVWLEERMEDRFFDPIAVLGAETPRLDMGMTRFCLTASGKTVEKYTASFPSSTNTFAPQFGTKQKHYESGSPSMALTPEDVNQIIDALMQTEPMQWVTSQMGGETPAPGSMTPDNLGDGSVDAAAPPEPLPAPGQPGGAPAPMGEPAPPAPDLGAPAPPPSDIGGAPPGLPEEDEEMQPYSCDDEDYDKMQAYMAGDIDDEEIMAYRAGKKRRRKRHAGTQRYEADGAVEGGDAGHNSASGDIDGVVAGPGSGEVENLQYSRRERARYAKVQAENRQLADRVKRLEAENRRARIERARASREAELVELAQYHRMSIETELQRCDPERMSDQAFRDHVDGVIKENYEKLPVGVPFVYAPDLPAKSATNRQNYSKEQCEKARRIVLERREKGQVANYDSVLEEVATGSVA